MEQDLKQDGTAEEQPTEDTSKVASEVVSTDEKTVSEKTRTDEIVRNLQSSKDKAEFRAKKAEEFTQSVQKELQEFRSEIERQKQEARQKEIDALASEPEEQAKLRRKFSIEDFEQKTLKELKEKEVGLSKKYNQALDLIEKYGLYNAFDELMKVESPREMELLAQVKAAEKAKGQVKKEAYAPDSATSDAAPSDFKKLEQDFIKDPYKYGKQYKEALAKRGQ